MQDETLRETGLTLAEQFMAEGKRDALRASILDFLEARFGEIPYAVREAIERIEDTQRLATLPRAAARADSLDAFLGSLA